MGFKKIVLASPQGEGEIPWLSELLKTQPEIDGKMFQVKAVAFSQKGVMIASDFFKSFLFRSNPYYDFLREALEVWTTSNIPVHALMVMVDSKEKTKMHIGVEDSLESNWEKKSETLFKLKLGVQDFSSTQTVNNPLLAVSSPSVTPKRASGRGKAGKGGQAGVAGKAARSLANAFPGSEVMDLSLNPDEPFDAAWGVESED